jgi:hypothetical protein
MSKIEVNAIEPQCGTTLTVGAAGTTVTVPSNVVKSNALQASDAGNIISQSGTTITLGATGDSINLASGATQSGFGRTGTVDWITTPKTTGTFTAVSGEGYFLNTSGGVITANLPAGVAGAIVSFADYAGTWQTSNVTVVPNGTDKIGSTNANATLSTEGQSVTFIFVDSTQGWINTMDSTSNVRGGSFIVATGGTPSQDGDYEIRTFTGPGTFAVASLASNPADNVVDYLVVGGGGAAGDTPGNAGGGGGAGGFRFFANPSTNPQPGSNPGAPRNAPAGIPVSVQSYTITVGGGGTARASDQGNNGSVSTFSTITSSGGGGGGYGTPSACGARNGLPGASGGGGGGGNTDSGGGTGNVPIVSPLQGTDGGSNANGPGTPDHAGSGGGGALVAGQPMQGTTPGAGGAGGGLTGFGSSNGQCSSSVQYFAGGGAGGTNVPTGGGTGAGGIGGGGAPPGSPGATGGAGTVNTGGGGGGGASNDGCGGAGGSGIVVIRYKFQ